MIGAAIRDLLATAPTLAPIIEDRVTPYRFDEAGLFPALTYNTRDVGEIGCRGGDKVWQGTMEIAMLTNTPTELETLSEALTELLSNYNGQHAGYSLSTEAAETDYTETEEDLKGYYKALTFTFIATKLTN